MQPLPMNEFMQQSLKQCFFDVQFDVIEWNTLFTNWRKGAKDASANGSADAFKAVAGHLARQYRVVTYDRRGFLHSQLVGSQDCAHRLETNADDVWRLRRRI